jgi:hypothetical protein
MKSKLLFSRSAPFRSQGSLLLATVAATGFLLAVGGCGTLRGHKSAEAISTQGPTVLNARATPGTIVLNRDLQPKEKPEIIAEVKDLNAKVSQVELRFLEIPDRLPLKNVHGSTWRVEIPPALLKKLAVGNQTTVYRANIVAKNEKGQSATSPEPVKISVKAPDLSTIRG